MTQELKLILVLQLSQFHITYASSPNSLTTILPQITPTLQIRILRLPCTWTLKIIKTQMTIAQDQLTAQHMKSQAHLFKTWINCVVTRKSLTEILETLWIIKLWVTSSHKNLHHLRNRWSRISQPEQRVWFSQRLVENLLLATEIFMHYWIIHLR